ncbi:hypothetical protein SAMN03097699_3043 [Flavobacteriaceae bacterium MAR_2010_188]|nr:hypothetical protein SAMN03097699_3043 [Flavobacteriaceae bacterium MAR_2010_188]
MKKAKILFITTSSLASNPRLVKEFEALKYDFSCYVLCFKHRDWSLELSKAVKQRNPEVHFIEIDRNKVLSETIICKIVHKGAIILNSIFNKNFKISAFANNDKALQLWFHTKSISQNVEFSRVIAHNLGAFYPAVKLSEKKTLVLQLDIEDYYPGEALYFNRGLERTNRMNLMAYSFLKADAITYASKGIQLECQHHFKIKSSTKQLTILNVFNAEDFSEPQAEFSAKIKCVWFSQHIGPNRGLENVFEAAKTLNQIEFHLIGNLNQDFLNKFKLSENIKLHSSMQQKYLHEFLCTMDLGLALENVEADRNRNICLTNKFLAYAQAGLYILATDTYGQAQFLKTLDYEAGVIIRSSLKDTLQNLDDKLLRHTSKIYRWQSAKSYSWENEQLKLKALVS